MPEQDKDTDKPGVLKVCDNPKCDYFGQIVDDFHKHTLPPPPGGG